LYRKEYCVYVRERKRERNNYITIYIKKCIRTIYVEKCIRIYKNIKVKNIKYEYKNEVVICLLSMFYNTKNIRNYTTNYTKLNVNVVRYKKVKKNI